VASAWVQDETLVDDSSASTIAKAFGTNVTAGNLILVAVGYDSDVTPTCTDSLGNTYTAYGKLWDATNVQGHAHRGCLHRYG